LQHGARERAAKPEV